MGPITNSVVFHFQDPSVPGKTLLDALADAAHGAESGGGIFAFASAQGIAMFLDDPVIEPWTKTANFELVVGMDAITDTRALSALVNRLPHRPGLTARVLLHELPALFHPKLTWFVRGETVILVVGSGNLTPGGLTNNLEAFTVATLQGPAANDVQTSITEWLNRWEAQLFAPDAPKAKARAKQNSGSERSLKKPMAVEDEESSPEFVPVHDESAVLVLEISRNAPRRTQSLVVPTRPCTSPNSPAELPRSTPRRGSPAARTRAGQQSSQRGNPTASASLSPATPPRVILQRRVHQW